MKQSSIVVSSFFIIMSVFAHDEHRTPTPIVINIANAQSSDIKQELENKPIVSFSASFANTVYAQAACLSKEGREHLDSLYSFLKHYIKKNKFKLAAATLATLYTLIFTKIWVSSHKVSHATRWSSWKETYSLEMLHTARKDVTRELLLTIQHEYQKAEYLADFFFPLMEFVQEIDQEKKELHSLQVLIKTLETLHIGRFFLYPNDLYAEIEQKIKRLTLLKDLIIEWLAEYKYGDYFGPKPLAV